MSRRSKPERRIPSADPIYNCVDVSKFINRVMRRGKKSLAERIFYSTIERIKERTNENGLEIFQKALTNATPLLEVKAGKGAKNQRTVELQLISTKNKITNYEVMLTFFQKENVSQDVLPLEASIFFVDEDNNKISGEQIIFADKSSDSAEDREFKEKFRLLQKQYDKSKNYYLIIRDLKEDVEVDRIPFTIDIAFQDGFDFF